MTQHMRFPRSLTTGIALAAAAAVLCLTACAPAEADAVRTPAPAGLKSRMTDAVQAGIPGAVVRIDSGDEVISLTEHAAWAEPFSAGDTLRVGSNTKTATAVVVLQLVDEGRLDLDDPISTWFADTVPGSEDLTVRMLLNHTSGLADCAREPAILAAMAGHRDDLPSDEELIAAGLHATVTGEPVDGFRYSNTGYTLLGQIVEEITGSPLPEVFQERIAEPLGLTQTHFAERGAGERAEIRGYEPDARPFPLVQSCPVSR